MEYTFSSHTRNALLSENNYEIASHKESIHKNISLQGSVTAMGTITYTLTFTSDVANASLGPTLLTWTDTILTYRSHDPLQMSLPIAAKRTLSRWLTSIIIEESKTKHGDLFWKAQAARHNFCRQCELAFHVITCFVLNSYYSFANTISEETKPNTREEEDLSSSNYLP